MHKLTKKKNVSRKNIFRKNVSKTMKKMKGGANTHVAKAATSSTKSMKGKFRSGSGSSDKSHYESFSLHSLNVIEQPKEKPKDPFKTYYNEIRTAHLKKYLYEQGQNKIPRFTPLHI